jgi:hypothetical protein
LKKQEGNVLIDKNHEEYLTKTNKRNMAHDHLGRMIREYCVR